LEEKVGFLSLSHWSTATTVKGDWHAPVVAALWTKELEVALLSGQVDAIVHSLKDVPTEFPPGCELGAVLEREDPTDALVVKEGLSYTSLDEMPDGSVIGTSSVRRVAQLRRKFPRLKFADVRGNLGTRLKKLDAVDNNYTALILASAGLIRIGLGHRITAAVASPTLYHAVGQGAIGVEIRAGDRRSRDIIGSLECWKTSWRTRAERMMLKVLEGGCSVPVGCETKITEVFVKGGEGDHARRRPVPAIDTHGYVVERDEFAAPLSPELVSDFPPTSPISPVISPNGLPLVGSPPKPPVDLSKIGQPDETTGIPDGHPAVNPAHICPVTGKMLPGAPRSPRMQGAQLPGLVGVAPLNNGNGTAAHHDDDGLPARLHTHTCTHRPGMPPSCPSDARMTTHHATLTLTGTITSLSGTRAVLCTLARRVHSIWECEQLGADVARELIEGGGDEILTELGRHVKGEWYCTLFYVMPFSFLPFCSFTGLACARVELNMSDTPLHDTKNQRSERRPLSMVSLFRSRSPPRPCRLKKRRVRSPWLPRRRRPAEAVSPRVRRSTLPRLACTAGPCSARARCAPVPRDGESSPLGWTLFPLHVVVVVVETRSMTRPA
jgi:hydroxymethylbilane synthase